jgi:hypothetical protein
MGGVDPDFIFQNLLPEEVDKVDLRLGFSLGFRV